MREGAIKIKFIMILNIIKILFGGLFILSGIISLLLGSFVLGLILSIIGLLILRKKKNKSITDNSILSTDYTLYNDIEQNKNIVSDTEIIENQKKAIIQEQIKKFELSGKSKEKGVFYKLNIIKSYVPDYQVKHFDDKHYFKEYTRVDGDWVNENEVICYINNYFPILSDKSGYIEHIFKKGDLLKDGDRVAIIHNEGEYSKQNSIQNDNYYHYCKKKHLPFSSVNWFVNDGEYVRQGHTIYSAESVYVDKFSHKAEKNGYIDINYIDKFKEYKQKDLIYTIRTNDQIRVNKKYVNIPEIIFDDFTKTKSIYWKKISTQNIKYSKGIISLSDDKNIELTFTFNYIKANDYIVFYFNPKQIKLKTNDIISFLFNNDEVISFQIINRPAVIKNKFQESEIEIKFLITKRELELFTSEYIKKWKITLVETNIEILGGDYGLINEYYTKSNLAIVINKFAIDYLQTVKKEIKDYIPLEFIEENDDIRRNEKCYVYLMKDTANDFYKIGISSKPEYREKTLQSEKPTIELIITKEYPIRKIAESFEKALHETYSEKRIRGEWFKLEEEDVTNIKGALK
jgi:biotin carboxyl carrier protein